MSGIGPISGSPAVNVLPLAAGASLTTAVAAFNAAVAAMKGSGEMLPDPLFVPALLAYSPTSFFLIDEPSGTSAADASGNGHTGTYINSPTLNVTGPVAGHKAFTNALYSQMSSTNGGVDLAADWAAGVWVKPSSLTQIGAFLGLGGLDISHGLYIGIGDGAGGTGAHLWAWVFTRGYVDALYVFPDTTSWHLVVCASISGVLHFMVDTAEVATSAVVPVVTTGRYFVVSAMSDGSRCAVGSYALPFTMPHGLTLAQVAALYRTGVGYFVP